MNVEQIKSEATNLKLFEYVKEISYYHCRVGNERLRTEFPYREGRLIAELNGEFAGLARVLYKSENCDNLVLYRAYSEGIEVDVFHNGPWVAFLTEKGEEAKKGFAEISKKNGAKLWDTSKEEHNFTTTII